MPLVAVGMHPFAITIDEGAFFELVVTKNAPFTLWCLLFVATYFGLGKLLADACIPSPKFGWLYHGVG